MKNLIDLFIQIGSIILNAHLYRSRPRMILKTNKKKEYMRFFPVQGVEYKLIQSKCDQISDYKYKSIMTAVRIISFTLNPQRLSEF